MATDTKNVSILEEKDRRIITDLPSLKEQEVVNAVFHRFRQVSDNRNRNFENFDGLNLIDYIDDSVRRFTTNVDYREGLEDWQARVHDPFTRNKVNAVLGKIIQVLPIAEFVSAKNACIGSTTVSIASLTKSNTPNTESTIPVIPKASNGLV